MTSRSRRARMPVIEPARRGNRIAIRRRLLEVACVLMLLGTRVDAQVPSPSDGWRTFEASFSASGHEHILSLGDHDAEDFELSGTFLVTSGDGLSRGFRAQVIGFVDEGRIGVGRLVLTDEQGDQIFNDLDGQAPGTGKRVRGTITGGTGRYARIEGSFEFDWRYLIHTEDGTIQGRAVDLHGRFRQSPAPAAPGGGATP